MKVKGVSESQLTQAITETGLIYNRQPERKGPWLHFTVRLESCRDRYHRRHRLHSPTRPSRRGVFVCWHGHRDFMRTLFDLAPQAILVSAFARYDGQEGFWRDFPATGGRNVGSRMYPVRLDESCDCQET